MESLLLHIYHGNGRDRFSEVDPNAFDKATLTMGSSPEDDIPLVSTALPGHALLLDKDAEGFRISDNNGQGLLYFQGKAIQGKVMAFGDTFHLGAQANASGLIVVLVKRCSEYPEPSLWVDASRPEPVTIGRGSRCHIRYTDPMVSEAHAQITRMGDLYILEDRQSTNGTFVNGKQIHVHTLADGDRITIGGNKLRFQGGKLCLATSGRLQTSLVPTGQQGPEEAFPKPPKQDQPPPAFQPSPMLAVKLPEGEVVIPSPSVKGEKQPFNWVTLLPSVGMLLTALLIGTMSGAASAALSMVMAVMSVITGVATYYVQNNRTLKLALEQRKRYTELLDAKKREIAVLHAQQAEGLLQISPDLPARMAIVRERQRRMWERTPQSTTFLWLRLGRGDIPFLMQVKLAGGNLEQADADLVNEMNRIAAESRQVKNAPVSFSLAEYPLVGAVGLRRDVLSWMRAMALDLAVHHTYDEVKLVAVFPQEETAEWESLRWLPHVWDGQKSRRMLASAQAGVQQLFDTLTEILKQREALCREEKGPEVRIPHYVFLLGDPQLIAQEPLIPYLLKSAQLLGVSCIFLYDKIESLPRECEVILLREAACGKLIYRDMAGADIALTPDTLPAKELDRVARAMAPVRLMKRGKDFDLPQKVSFFEMYGVESPNALNIAERWKQSTPYLGLRVPVGLTSGGKTLELLLGEGSRSHGIHGLVAGMTRSGKSEFLQTLILSLAASYSPLDVAFVLIDYKGGATANAFRGMPHLAGIIDNIGLNEKNLSGGADEASELKRRVHRALASLYSESRRRQMLLAGAGVNNIMQYQKKYRNGELAEPLPHLLIIADEFAELKQASPEFIDKLVSIARTGGSLGIKLILATQRPSGVVDPQIKSNAGYKVCLQVESRDDSREMLDKPDAALINNPGRAYLKVGEGVVYELFQSAWSGAPAEARGGDDEGIFEVSLDGSRQPLKIDIHQPALKDGPTQLAVTVSHIIGLAREIGLPSAISVWLPPLPAVLPLMELEKLSAPENRLPLLGLVDDSEAQRQYPYEADFFRTGNLVVYGGPGAGKTTLLQTLILSMARCYTPEDFSILVLDFGVRAMRVLEALPLVGGVAMGDQEERVRYAFRLISQEMNSRRKLFSQVGAASLSAYREAVKTPLPAILLVIDNLPSLLEWYPNLDDPLLMLARDGGSLGVYLAVTAGANALKGQLSACFGMTVALRLGGLMEYGNVNINIGEHMGRMVPAPLPGRGLVRGERTLEFQAALPAPGDSEMERNRIIQTFIGTLPLPKVDVPTYPIPVLPESLAVERLLADCGDMWANGCALPLGLDMEAIEPIYQFLQEDHHLTVLGPSRQTNAQTLNLIAYAALGRMKGLVSLYVLDTEAGAMAELKKTGNVECYASRPQEVTALVAQVCQRLQQGDTSQTEPEEHIFLLVADYARLSRDLPDDCAAMIERWIRGDTHPSVHVFVAGLPTDLNGAWSGVGKALRDLQKGICLTEPANQQFFSTSLSFAQASRPLRAGEAYYISLGKAYRIKIPVSA